MSHTPTSTHNERNENGQSLPPLAPKFVPAGQGTYWESPDQVRIKILEATDTNNQLAVTLVKANPGGQVAPYAHDSADELFYIQSGEFLVELNDQTHHLAAGDFVFAPRLVTRSISCLGDGGGEFWLANILANSEALQAPVDQPFVVRSTEGECLEAFGDKARVLMGSQRVQGRYCCAESEAPSLSGPPPHRHLYDDETFIIRAGRYEFMVGDSRIEAGIGDVVFAPHGIPHTFRVISDEPASFLLLVVPGGFDDFFRTASELFSSGLATPEKLIALGQQCGIEFLAPGA